MTAGQPVMEFGGEEGDRDDEAQVEEQLQGRGRALVDGVIAHHGAPEHVGHGVHRRADHTR